MSSENYCRSIKSVFCHVLIILGGVTLLILKAQFQALLPCTYRILPDFCPVCRPHVETVDCVLTAQPWRCSRAIVLWKLECYLTLTTNATSVSCYV